VVMPGARQIRGIAVAACLVIAALVFALTRSAGATAPAKSSAAPLQVALPTTSFGRGATSNTAKADEATAIANFAVFGKPAAAADALPARSAYAGGTARRIAGDSQTFSSWGVLSGGQVCVTVDASSGAAAGGPAACNSVADLIQPGQLLVLGAGTGDNQIPQLLVGLVPNGVQSVTVVFKDGSKVNAPVIDNGFALATGGRTPAHYSWTTAAGATETEPAGG
jgi:hypothetical protein